MSIRLKKVEWEKLDDGSFRAVILGDIYSVMFSDFRGEWCAWIRNDPWTDYHHSVSRAKAACEQHALERIREAVEVETDHIPDAKKMIDDWYDGDEISTGTVNGIPFRIVAGKDFLLEAYDPASDRFVIVSYWQTLEAAKSAAIERASHWFRPNRQAILDSWQPIETAPELEQVLIAYRGVNPNKPLIDVAFYHPDAKSWDVCGHVRVNPVRVFAWMPLPKPPKEPAT